MAESARVVEKAYDILSKYQDANNRSSNIHVVEVVKWTPQGNLVAACSQKMRYNPSPVIQAFAARKGCLLAGELNLGSIMESDSLQIIKALNNLGENLTNIGNVVLVMDCKGLLRSFYFSLCSHVKRTGNACAHSFPKHALNIPVGPDWTSSLLFADVLSDSIK
ncbi:hypothetical protein RHMOL_Rhmol03G0064700 [Rhododendron molle]|uniref:Uncharacterized protein n=1 Tax=Rhododendron molle TaxID=49168 RepID=A0ACC0PAU6_RHOML|nr:hypothetical protein RHMOL_Rhmol03G0064700 [Rhododendron molle]